MPPATTPAVSVGPGDDDAVIVVIVLAKPAHGRYHRVGSGPGLSAAQAEFAGFPLPKLPDRQRGNAASVASGVVRRAVRLRTAIHTVTVTRPGSRVAEGTIGFTYHRR